ncbi:MAG: helix-turn-helix domain-containing protein [Muribaculaceae bacterium]|nr:helix-turn-helix domain-containing protein [Muribaculaceae bacterium]MDE7110386.1 helix-turn-helix domain-containing protein [Muribaculaceae bacterium]
MIESVSLQQMKKLYEIADYDETVDGSDYIYVRITPDSNIPSALTKAMRFNGLIITLVKSGKLSASVNMERFNLTENCMVVTGANSIITFEDDSMQNLDASVLFVSNEFIHDLNFEIIVLNNLPIASNRAPLVTLTPGECAHMAAYLELLDMNARQKISEGFEMFHKGISRSLLTATLYQLMLMSCRAREEQPEEDPQTGGRPRSRRMLYTHEFVRLVNKYFRSEHSVRFYADRLCISPKYLSLVVKECTGRSAAEIIDEHLLLEAKNLLRFSGKNIQQVAYELNFSNQSSFGKYFKHLTGLSPSEFQNS